jgi:hypothetical protein
MVYFVGKAARLVITTRAREIIAPIINLKIAPLKRMADMVMGKNTAAMVVTDTPTQAILFFLPVLSRRKSV